MQITNSIVLLLLVTAACGAHREPPRATPPAPPQTREVVDDHATAVDKLVGVWLGDGSTPFGEIPIALEFSRQDDGAVQARLAGPGMYIDFRFHRDGGRWLLTEEGKLPGAGVQTHVLIPSGPGARWVDREDAKVLEVVVAVEDDAVVFATRLHGEDHATFRLKRVSGPRADDVRRAIARAGVSSS